MRRVLVFSFLVFCGYQGFSQSAACAQTLRLARATYEQGRLQELESQLKPCLETGFSRDQKQEKVEGYKLLCLSYIYLEEHEKADEAMLNILRTDHDFQINPAVDPAEFVALYYTFRSKPLFSIGIILGPNVTFPVVTENYAVGGSAAGKGKYQPGISFQAGLIYEKQLTEKFTAAPELIFNNRAFTYSHPSLFISDEDGGSTAHQTAELKQSWLDLNLLVQYKLGKGALNSFISAGPAVGLLLSAENTAETIFENGQVTSGPAIDLKSTYNKVGFSVLSTVGVKYKFGAIYIWANARYQLGLSKVVNEKRKSHPEAINNYAISPNIHNQQNAAFLVGFTLPVYNPKKLNR